MKNLVKLLSFICLAISFASCEELMTNTEIVSNEIPQNGVSSGFSLHDAKWTYRNISAYRTTVGTCFYTMQNQSFIVTRAAFNCVTESNELAKKIKKALSEGYWISREHPFPLSVSTYKNVVYKYVDQLCRKRADDISTNDVWPAISLLKYWCAPAASPYNPHYKLLNGKREERTEDINKVTYLYKTDNLFGENIKALLMQNPSGSNWRVSVNCPSKEMAALFKDIFNLYYHIENVNINDNGNLSFEFAVYDSYTIEMFDVITYQPLECVLITNGLLDMEYIKSHY